MGHVDKIIDDDEEFGGTACLFSWAPGRTKLCLTYTGL